MYWDGGLFDNTPLSALRRSTPAMRRRRAFWSSIVPRRAPGRQARRVGSDDELQFANKTEKDVNVARKINKLVAVIEELPPGRGR